MTASLLIGANSYLGQNLARGLCDPELVLSSRAEPNEFVAPLAQRFVQADLTGPLTELERLRPRRLWIVSRPNSQSLDLNLRFSDGLKRLVDLYARRFHLKEVVFFSTQLVYATPLTALPLTSRTPAEPAALYEYAKADFELYLRMLCCQFPLERVTVLRLPLLAGGVITAQQKREQLLYGWRQAHCEGRGWAFTGTEEEEAFGTSWVDVDDLVAMLAKERGGEGYRVCNVASGPFTYAELARGFPPSDPNPIGGKSAWLPRSQMYLADELGLPTRGPERLLARLAGGDPHG